jgi:hypothetical protein
MKALLLFFSLSLISFNSFSQEVKANDCCPYGNNCGGKVNCPGSGWRKNAEKREFTKKLSKSKKGSSAQGQ